MLIFGSLPALQYVQQVPWQTVPVDIVYNFNTLIENIPQLTHLNPYWDNMMIESIKRSMFSLDKAFDMWYVNYIGTYQPAFKQFMDIMKDVYNGKNIWILVDYSSDVAVNIIEILIKYISETYGYTCNVIVTPDDLENVVEGTFSTQGIQTFDANLETYINTFGFQMTESD